MFSQNVSLGISPWRLQLAALKDSRDFAPLKVSLLIVSRLPFETSIAYKCPLFIKVPVGNLVKNWEGQSRISTPLGSAGKTS